MATLAGALSAGFIPKPVTMAARWSLGGAWELVVQNVTYFYFWENSSCACVLNYELLVSGWGGGNVCSPSLCRPCTVCDEWWRYLYLSDTVSELWLVSYWNVGGTCLYLTLPLHCALAVIPYSGETFKGENFCELVKIQFSQRKLSRIARFCCAKGYHAPPILWRKLSRIAKKPQNSRKFSPSKVFRYTVVFVGYTCQSLYVCCHSHYTYPVVLFL